MHNRLFDNDGTLLVRVEARPHGKGDAPCAATRLAAAVRAGAHDGILRNRQALDALYLAVRDRVRELHADGRRAEQALMIVKHEVMSTISQVGLDAIHAAEIVQLVVRWSVSAYYAAN
jgi:hypothetical protein